MEYYASDYSSLYAGEAALAEEAALTMLFGAFAGIMTGIMIFAFIVGVLGIIAQWKIFTKAGEKGWKALIPIYNMVVLFKIIGLSPWLLLVYLLAFIPFVGSIAVLILAVFVCIKLAKAFNKGAGFTLGLIFLGTIFQLILAFGSAEYLGIEGKE